MSGTEAITIVQLIDACVGITRTIIEIGEAARDAKGLPDRLKELFERLPAIEDLLKLARENHDKVPNGDSESVESVLRQCKTSLEELRRLFWKACPEDGEHYSKRIWRGAKVVFFGRKSQLLMLLDTILGNLKLLEQKKIHEIGGRLDSLSKTIQTLAEDDSPMANNAHNGSKNQDILQGSGNMYNQGGGDHSTFHQHTAAPLTKTENRCLQSLAFPDMETRGDIDPKANRTCEWMSHHAMYLHWNRKGGLLWVKGMPGTGKSTLMEHLRKSKAPDSGSTNRGQTLILSFFFHRRGHELQRTSLGLFRSLLHQVLRVDQGLLSRFVKDTRFEARCRNEGEPGKDKRWDWMAPELQELLSGCILRATKTRTLRLYIDALDESGERAARMLMKYLQQLRTRAEGRLHVCVSSRPRPDVVLGWTYCINVAEENAQDIKRLLGVKLRKYSVTSVEIEDEIANRASGVFRWAIIVVDRVIALRAEDTATILAYIRATPGVLDDIYHEMFSKLVGYERTAALRLFRWITFAKRPLSLTEIRYAVAITADPFLRSSIDFDSSPHWCYSNEQMREKLKRLSLGLVEFIDTNRGESVRFDHESVQDYMLTRGIWFLEQTGSRDPVVDICERSEWILSSVCFLYLGCSGLLRADPDKDHLAAFPFASYAANYCRSHALNAKIGGHSVENVLTVGQWLDLELSFDSLLAALDETNQEVSTTIDENIESRSDDSSSVSADSILSFMTSASSASTLTGDAISDELIHELVKYLFCNNDLSPLNIAAIMDPAIGVEKFRNNMNRLIRHYGNDLKEDIASKDEFRVARVIRHGNVAIRAAQSIIDITEGALRRQLHNLPVIARDGPASPPAQGSIDSTESVQQHIPLAPLLEDDSDDDIPAPEDEFEDPGLALEIFINVKEAFLESRAYTRLKARLLDFVNKPYQKRILKAIGSEAVSSSGTALSVVSLKALALELSFVPAMTVTFSYVEPISYSDMVKGLVEICMGESWEWSPLAQRKFPLKTNWCRVMWKTPSDDLDHVDLPAKAAEALRVTMQSAPIFVSIAGGPQRSKARTTRKGISLSHAKTASPVKLASSAPAHLSYKSLVTLGLFGTTILLNYPSFLEWMLQFALALTLFTVIVLLVPWRCTRANRIDLPDTIAFSRRSGHDSGSLSYLPNLVSQASVSNLQTPQQTHGNPVPSLAAGPGTSLSASTLPPVVGLPPGPSGTPMTSSAGSQHMQIHHKQPNHGHVFLCVRNWKTYKFSDIETHLLRSDSEFFRRLKSEYLLLRGSYERWFSWWQYDRCDFYRFSQYPMGEESEAVPVHIGFPGIFDAGYDFFPRPADPCPPGGPISDREFRNRFHKSCDHCHSWHLWHKRKSNGGIHSLDVIARLPKRETALDMKHGRREHFWGLYARERRSFARVFAYGVLANTPGIVFFFMWLFRWGHNSDLQNAAVPVGLSLSLTMLFVALLYESREVELR